MYFCIDKKISKELQGVALRGGQEIGHRLQDSEFWLRCFLLFGKF